MSFTPKTDAIATASTHLSNLARTALLLEHARAMERNAGEWERLAMLAGNDAQELRRKIHDAACSHVLALMSKKRDSPNSAQD